MVNTKLPHISRYKNNNNARSQFRKSYKTLSLPFFGLNVLFLPNVLHKIISRGYSLLRHFNPYLTNNYLFIHLPPFMDRPLQKYFGAPISINLYNFFSLIFVFFLVFLKMSCFTIHLRLFKSHLTYIFKRLLSLDNIECISEVENYKISLQNQRII